MNAFKRLITFSGFSLTLTFPLCSVVLLSIFTCFACASAKSQIVFENGIYQNITIALDENDISIEQGCADILSTIRDTFSQASVYLQQGTEGRAAFGSIRVLIPEKWNYSSCGPSINKPSFFEAYETADIKVTASHPIAATLPWTDQVGLCGASGSNIYLPSNFLWNTNFTTETRASMLLHEWMKFRYGVFEEYGFFGDPFFPACYSKGSETFYTACMSPSPPPLETVSQNPRTCKQLIEENRSRLLTQVTEAASRSIMFAPQITPTQSLVCKDQSNNRLAVTKQNYLCDRQSVQSVILRHSDFELTVAAERVEQINSVVIHPVKLSKQTPAYAIVVDDSKALTDLQIETVLRSVWEFLHFVRPEDKTMLYFMPIDQDLDQFPPMVITTQAQKEEFYELISATLQIRPGDNESAKVDSDVYQIVQDKLKIKGPEKKWHVLHIATPPPNPIRVLPALKMCDFQLKLVTFDTGYRDWLQWNGVVQTQIVLVLPTCAAADAVCFEKTSLILTSTLLEDLRTEDPSRHFQLVFSGTASNRENVSLSDLKVPVKRFLMTMHSPGKNAQLTVASPGHRCAIRNLTNNTTNHLLSTNCFYEPGNWTVSGSDEKNGLVVRAFVEFDGNGIRALPQVGYNLAEAVYPNRHRMSIPLHIGVRSKLDQPVLTAAVEADISFLRSTGLETRTFQLRDDGIYPDSTKDDGIYSAYLVGWSEQPSYHFGLVRITNNEATRVLTETSTDTVSAALLDTKMDRKCCGSAVPLQSTVEAPPYVTLVVPLPSMFTGETLNNPSLRPPGEITFLEKTSENEVSVQLTVVSPESGNEDPVISHFLVCSTECIDGCAMIDPEECKPTKPGEDGVCVLNKAKLQESVSLWNCPTVTFGSLQLALAGVNSADERGRLSRQVFDVTFSGESSNQESTCKSLKDKCLPIWLFWTLAGTLGGLLILIILILICVCCICRRNNNKNVSEGKAAFISKPYAAEKLTNGGFRPTTPKELERKYAHTASIAHEEANSSAYFTQRTDVRRPPGEENLGYTSFSASTAKRMAHHNEKDHGNMHPQYTHQSRSQQDLGTGNYSSVNSKSLPRRQSIYEEDAHAQISLKSPRNQKEVTPSRPVSQIQDGPKIRTVSSFIDENAVDMTSPREPAYATVSRKHRRNPQNPAYRYSQPPLMTQHAARPIQFVTSKDNTRPRSTIGTNFGNRGSVDRFTSRPVRMDHFPSSESETYSEMSRLESLPPGPPPPPPLPSASNSTKFHQSQQTSKRETLVRNDEDSDSSSVAPDSLNRAATPSSQVNGYGILAQLGSLPDRKAMLKAPKQGPPPPPPRSSGRKFDPAFLHSNNTHDIEDSPAMGRQTRTNDVDENDSDTWDIDDDFQYDPDVSHV